MEHCKILCKSVVTMYDDGKEGSTMWPGMSISIWNAYKGVQRLYLRHAHMAGFIMLPRPATTLYKVLVRCPLRTPPHP